MSQIATDTSAYNYKLDYDIPESPAFSILDANPSTVMRGSAAKEVMLQFANGISSGNRMATGVAVDFIPYFVLGGRLKNIDEYRNSQSKRILANTQFSFASLTSVKFPTDNLLSAGLRITLFDSRDLLSNKELGSEIDKILLPKENPDVPQIDPSTGQLVDISSSNIISLPELSNAYANTKEKLRNMKGGAVSIGMATAGRMLNGAFHLDSLLAYKNQFWISGQYSFGKGINISGLAMYRNNIIQNKDNINELMLGLGFRHMGKKSNIAGEFVYSSIKKHLEVNVNFEMLVMNRLIFYASIGNRSDIINDDNKIKIIPGIKYNLSEPKNQ